MDFELLGLALQRMAVEDDLRFARPRQLVERKIRFVHREQGRPGVRKRAAQDHEVPGAERSGMHLARLPDGHIPTACLQVSRDAVRILQVAHIGDLPRGEASPEAQQILLLHQFRHIQISQVLVFLAA